MNASKVESLQSLISNMKLPEHRKTKLTVDNIKWLGKNIGVFNGSHKNFEPAREIIVDLLREENLLCNTQQKKLVANNLQLVL